MKSTLKTAVMLLAFICISLVLSGNTIGMQNSEDDNNISSIEKKMLGKHMCSLQWISWDYFGSVTIERNAEGQLTCKGGQKSQKNSDYLTLDGVISIVNEKHFTFTGTIETKVSFLNNGEPVTREGTFNFKASGERKYWRFQEMKNPADMATDYVDIYFK